VYRPSDRRAKTYAGCVRRRCCPWWVTTALTSEEKTERTDKHRIDALKARSQHMKRTELTWTCRHNYAERHAARQRHDILRTYWLKTLRSELGRVVLNTGFPIKLFTLEVVANCSSVPFASCERGFTLLWPSDPVTRESSDPETQLTRWPCSIMNSKCRLMLQKNVCNGQEVCQFLSLFGVCTLLESKILKIIY